LLKTSEDIAPLKTAGVLHNELRNKELDSCSHFDLGYAFSDDTYKGVLECIERHWYVFGDHVNEFCVVCVLVHGEGNLKYVIRRKFSGWPYLPDPMPNQSVWMINKSQETAQFLWSLPTSEKMAELSESFSFLTNESRTKVWCDAFFKGFPTFWKAIRKMHGIELLSESEFNDRNRELGGKFIDDKVLGCSSDPLYLPEIRIKKLEAMSNIIPQKIDNDFMRKAD
jgi:hypothetical protein